MDTVWSRYALPVPLQLQLQTESQKLKARKYSRTYKKMHNFLRLLHLQSFLATNNLVNNKRVFKSSFFDILISITGTKMAS